VPIYEFHCEHCGKDSEILIRSRESKGTICPHCHSPKLSKKFSVFASGGGDNPGPARKTGGGGGCCGGGPHRH